MKNWLELFNTLALWQRSCFVWGFQFESVTFDRLLNLWLHRLCVMGSSEKSFFLKHVRPGMTLMEVGANQGLYTCLLASIVGPTGRVIAFEPDPRLFACIQRNLVRNNLTNVECHCVGLSGAPGSGHLFRGVYNSGDNRLSVHDTTGVEVPVDVRLVRGDSIINGRKVDFIKIDVQGWEPAVLSGLSDTLSANPNVAMYLEYWPYGLKSAGFTPEELLNNLIAQDFNLMVEDADSLQPVVPGDKRLKLVGIQFVNLFARR